MITTSFARQMDVAGYGRLVFGPLPMAQNQDFANKAKQKSVATPFSTAAERRANGSNKDGQLGGFILDAFFNAAFPGFGVVFGAIGLLDVADVGDEMRSAFARTGRPRAQTTFMSSLKQRQSGAPVPAMMRRRKPGLLSFMFG